MKTGMMSLFMLLPFIGSAHSAQVVIHPQEYDGPVRNPFKGIESRVPLPLTEKSNANEWYRFGGEGFPVEPDSGHANFQSVLYEYTSPAPEYTIEGTFRLPADIPDGIYIIALAVLNPKGKPTLRFAISNYFNGGRHPMGYIGVNRKPVQAEIDQADFDDIFGDPLCIPDNPGTIKSRKRVLDNKR